LRKALEFGWLDREQTEMGISRYNRLGRQAALQGARESMVLLKNDLSLLPLNKQQIKSIAVIGPNAYPAKSVGGGSAHVVPFGAVSFLEGVSNYLGTAGQTYFSRGLPTLHEMAFMTRFMSAEKSGDPGLTVEYFEAPEPRGNPLATRIEPRIHLGFSGGFMAFFEPTGASSSGIPDTWNSVRWSGYLTPGTAGPHEVFVQAPGDGNGYRLYIDDKLVIDRWLFPTAIPDFTNVVLDATPHKIKFEYVRWQNRYGVGGTPRLRLGITPTASMIQADAKAIAAKADAVVLAVGFDLETESEANDRTFRLPPGQEQLIQEIAAVNKNTIVVLTSGGAVDMNSWLDKVRAVLQVWYPGQEGGTALAEVLFGDVNPSGRLPVTFERRWEDNPVYDSYYPPPGSKRVEYKEGVFVGYRGYEKKGVKPLFPFGHGLSYTTFKYQGLSITPVEGNNSSGPRFEISFDIQNTGSRGGSEVAQVYVADGHARIPRPAKELKGFVKVNLRPGETRRVSVTLDGRSFAYYDTGAKQWRAEPGAFKVLVGHSSEQIELRGNLTLTAAQASAIR
jgi:beta-glucosidase